MNDTTELDQAFAAKPQPLKLDQTARITPATLAVDNEVMIDVRRMRGNTFAEDNHARDSELPGGINGPMD